MQIFTRSPLGRTAALSVSPSHTVEEVKAMVREKEGIPLDQQSVVWTGKPLKNGSKLSDYNIPKMATLKIALPLKGGTVDAEVLFATTRVHSTYNALI